LKFGSLRERRFSPTRVFLHAAHPMIDRLQQPTIPARHPVRTIASLNCSECFSQQSVVKFCNWNCLVFISDISINAQWASQLHLYATVFSFFASVYDNALTLSRLGL
jgi:hypothetical protein